VREHAHVVRHQVALIHELLRLLASLGAGCNLRAQQVASRDVRKAVLGDDQLALFVSVVSREQRHAGEVNTGVGGAQQAHGCARSQREHAWRAAGTQHTHGCGSRAARTCVPLPLAGAPAMMMRSGALASACAVRESHTRHERVRGVVSQDARDE
jgi:hypothetical protein